jgi:predicted LPLAT superfamily acyltransferase
MIVTIMGDRFIKGSYSKVDFYGESVRLPDAPFVLSAASGAPVVVLLAAKTGRKKYQLKVWDYFYPEYNSRDEREAMLRKCAERYVGSIEEYLHDYPFQWYNFYNFWEQ